MLLVAYFKSAAIRRLALMATASQNGEDGWCTGTVVDGSSVDFVPGKGYPADINCSEVSDAVATWAGLFIAFAKSYGMALDPSEIVPEYREEA